MSERKWFGVVAGSHYGGREAIYEVVEGRLVLRDEGEHDNLAGNSLVLDFEGLTPDQAGEKCKSLNSEGSGHDYDGCHGCCWSIGCSETTPPEHLTYREPQEAEIIRNALETWREGCCA